MKSIFLIFIILVSIAIYYAKTRQKSVFTILFLQEHLPRRFRSQAKHNCCISDDVVQGLSRLLWGCGYCSYILLFRLLYRNIFSDGEHVDERNLDALLRYVTEQVGWVLYLHLLSSSPLISSCLPRKYCFLEIMSLINLATKDENFGKSCCWPSVE